MSEIVVRTSLGPETGIGHYVRMHRLCVALAGMGHPVQIWVDAACALRGVPRQIPVAELYHDVKNFCVDTDAEIMLRKLAGQACKLVIVDDYRLGHYWEDQVRNAGYKVVVFDDLCRAHCCDMLIDMKWRGDSGSTAYDELVDSSTISLLGPAYAIIDSVCPISSPKGTANFMVTLSLGGGGDGSLLASIAEGLIISEEYERRPVTVYVVMGPQMYNRNVVEAVAAKYPAIRLVTNAESLEDVFDRTNLYIGAIGGTIYELLARKIPAITFPISANQKTDARLLKDIGHHFHISDFTKNDLENLIALFWIIVEKYGRVKKLCENPRIYVDGKGCRRVANAVEALLLERDQPPTAALYPKPILEEKGGCPIGGGYRIRSVNDDDMGHYLESRNLPANKQYMIRQDDIREIDHYRWWLQTRRTSFLLTKEGVPILYIWHERVFIEGAPYLVGGWFVCIGECRFNDAMVALSWQLKHCDATESGVSWIAVINRQNHFVRAMNQYMGFQDVTDRNSTVCHAINSYFKGASEDEYFFVYLQSDVNGIGNL